MQIAVVFCVNFLILHTTFII